MTYLIATIVIALALVGMAIGVIVGKRQLRGTCGGLAGRRDAEGNVLCDACSDPSPDCKGELEASCHEETPSEEHSCSVAGQRDS